MISHKPKKEQVGKKATDTSCSITLQKKNGSEVNRQNSAAPQVTLTLFIDQINQVGRVVYDISKPLKNVSVTSGM